MPECFSKRNENRACRSQVLLGSVSSRECLDAPAILVTFTAGRTIWWHVRYVITILIIIQIIRTSFAYFIVFFLYRLEKREMQKFVGNNTKNAS